MRTRPFHPSLLAPLAALSIAALSCGGPSSPDSQGVTLRGIIAGTAVSSASASSGTSSAASGEITVTVAENPAITATVGSDGTFTLRGLPTGGFTLIFMSGGASLGSIAFDEVKPNQEITITVRIDGGSVVLVEEQRNGIGHGDVEIEGLVASASPNPTGESRFTVNGKTIVARPGQTAIREGGRARSVNDVTVGRRVHVKGEWLPAEGGTQPVLAHEIVLQGGDEGSSPSNTCMIEGARVGERVELEGSVMSGGSPSFLLRVQGNRATGPVQVDASGATFECHPSSGPNAPTPAECQATVKAGAKVHVKGALQSCDTASALIRASRVVVQK